jgi:hypothetical protein
MHSIQGIRLLRNFGHETPCARIQRGSCGGRSSIFLRHEQAIGYIEKVRMQLVSRIVEVYLTVTHRELTKQKRFSFNGVIIEQPGIVAFTGSRIMDIGEIEIDLIGNTLTGILINLTTTTEEDTSYNPAGGH